MHGAMFGVVLMADATVALAGVQVLAEVAEKTTAVEVAALQTACGVYSLHNASVTLSQGAGIRS